ncbi:MAG: PqqD family protein, partial [Acidobacteriota bacterium]
EHLPQPRYASGRVELVCFPWNEPDRPVWNPLAAKVEAGWKVIPPELCLKNRAAGAGDASQVFVQPAGRGPLLPAAAAVFAEVGGAVVVANVESGRAYRLEGTAGAMWRAMMTRGTIAGITDELAATYAVSRRRLRADASRLLADLRDRGLVA